MTNKTHPSPPGRWSWCQDQMNSRPCSCRWTGSRTPSHCWWWAWRGRRHPQLTVCSAPLCTSPAAFLFPSPTRSPSTPTPAAHTRNNTHKDKKTIVLGDNWYFHHWKIITNTYLKAQCVRLADKAWSGIKACCKQNKNLYCICFVWHYARGSC